MRKNTSLFLIVLASVATSVAVWALLHFTASKRHGQSANNTSSSTSSTNADLWNQAVEKVKEDRGAAANAQGGGARFTVRLPLATRTEAQAPAAENGERTAPPPRVIYVETYAPNRTDADIIASQKKESAARKAAALEKRRQFQALQKRLGIE